MKQAALFLLLSLGVFLPKGTADDKVRVSSFSTILTEIAQRVGGERVVVYAHVKPGIDPHEFEPKPEDLKVVAQAQLVLLSAKHMESYVDKLQESATPETRFLKVGDEFPSLTIKAAPGAGEKGAAGESVEDPHWWQSVENVTLATEAVRAQLMRIDPADRAEIAGNAAKYLAELAALERWIKSELAKLPRDQRKLVTSHDAFQYFARDYGFTIYPIEGITPEDQPSSKKIATLIQIIKDQKVKAIFPETLENPKVLAEITRETGAKIGEPLAADGLGEGEMATYAGMMRHNVTAIVSALR